MKYRVKYTDQDGHECPTSEIDADSPIDAARRFHLRDGGRECDRSDVVLVSWGVETRNQRTFRVGDLLRTGSSGNPAGLVSPTGAATAAPDREPNAAVTDPSQLSANRVSDITILAVLILVTAVPFLFLLRHGASELAWPIVGLAFAGPCASLALILIAWMFQEPMEGGGFVRWLSDQHSKATKMHFGLSKAYLKLLAVSVAVMIAFVWILSRTTDVGKQRRLASWLADVRTTTRSTAMSKDEFFTVLAAELTTADIHGLEFSYGGDIRVPAFECRGRLGEIPWYGDATGLTSDLGAIGRRFTLVFSTTFQDAFANDLLRFDADAARILFSLSESDSRGNVARYEVEAFVPADLTGGQASRPSIRVLHDTATGKTVVLRRR